MGDALPSIQEDQEAPVPEPRTDRGALLRMEGENNQGDLL